MTCIDKYVGIYGSLNNKVYMTCHYKYYQICTHRVQIDSSIHDMHYANIINMNLKQWQSIHDMH